MRHFQVNIRKEATKYGFMPTLQLYLLNNNEKQRPMIVIVPGGGYSHVCIEEEGDKHALQYNAAGFHASVIQYCVQPHVFPEAMMDLAISIKLLRDNAKEWGILEDMIIVCGFSAGGHLCASLSTLWNNSQLFSNLEIQSKIYKPNATILISAILTTQLLHCRDFLLAHVAWETDKLKLVTCDEQVCEDTPPTFLYSSYEDCLANVENALFYATKLKHHNVPFELHILPKGGHGEPWCNDLIWSKPARERKYNYIEISIEWIKELFRL